MLDLLKKNVLFFENIACLDAPTSELLSIAIKVFYLIALDAEIKKKLKYCNKRCQLHSE